MAFTRGANLTPTQKERFKKLEGKVSGRFLTAIQQLDKLSYQEEDGWRRGAFETAETVTTGGLTQATGTLRQLYKCTQQRDVIFTVMELGEHLQITITKDGNTYMAQIAEDEERDISLWRSSGGMVLDLVQTFPVLKAA